MSVARTLSALAFLVTIASCTHVQPGSAPTAGRASDGPRELTADEQVSHVLSRLTFGARPGDFERVREMGVDAWIETQLHPDSIGDYTLTSALAQNASWSKPTSELTPATVASLVPSRTISIGPPARVPPNTVVIGDLRDGVRVFADTMTAKTATKDSIFTVARKLDSSNVARRTADSLAGKPLAAISSAVSGFAVVLAGARLGGGNDFASGKLVHAQISDRQLLEVVADFWENHFSVYTAKAPGTEALAVFDRDAIRPNALGKFRDLLGAVAHSPMMLFYLDNQLSKRDSINENYARELMELHTLGVDGGYTQQDVINVARALTGWTLVRGTAQTPGARPGMIFTFDPGKHDIGAKVVLGHRLSEGRGIFDGEEVLEILAHHPSTAHYIAFKLARRFVSDSPPPALVDRAARKFTATDGDIAEVVRTIITSPEFFSHAALRAKVKTPFEYMVSTLRAFEAPPETSGRAGSQLTQMGQPMWGRLTPDGWPETGNSWMTSGAIYKRITFGGEIVNGRVQYVPVIQWSGWSLAGRPPAEQVDGVVRLVLGGVVSPGTRIALAEIASKPDAADSDGRTRLRDMVALALGSPEFQRR